MSQACTHNHLIAPEDVPEWHLAELARRRGAAENQPRLGRPFRDVLGPLEAEP